MASVLGSSGRTYCVLQHQSATAKHRLGENQEIIVDYAEIGRGSKCVVRFGEDCRMVSGVHAAVAKEGDSWVIHHHSTVNQTLVNGRPVNKRWYLNNGDIIQLASTGPKLGFIIPQNPAIGSIGLSRRLSLFRQQALRPYRTALIAVSSILILAVAVLAFFLYRTDMELERTNEELGFTVEKLQEARQISEEQAIAQAAVNDSLMQVNESFRKKMTRMQRKVRDLENRPPPAPPQPAPSESVGSAATDAVGSANASGSLPPLFKNVYGIISTTLSAEMNGQTETVEFQSQGTGFLLSDGRFITARHVVEPWFFIDPENDQGMLLLNIIASNGGEVTMEMKAISSEGTVTIISSDFTIDRTGDQYQSITGDDGNEYPVRLAGFRDGKDWAVLPLSRTGTIRADATLSSRLPATTQLFVVGYPMGVGMENITPQITTAEVTASGVSSGMINIAGNIDHGNSGGPVFVIQNGQPKAVGIVSSGVGSTMKFLIPISNVPGG